MQRRGYVEADRQVRFLDIHAFACKPGFVLRRLDRSHGPIELTLLEVAEGLFDGLLHLLGIDITDDDHGHVVGRVVAPEEAHDLLSRQAFDGLLAADDRPAIRVFGKRSAE